MSGGRHLRVFHASPAAGFCVIEPARSTHGEMWVYACRDEVVAALFLSGTGGDLTCAVDRDRDTGLPYVCERFPGALESRYGGRGGSIYTLPGDTFVAGRTGWDEEMTSPVAVRPMAEDRIPDAEGHLVHLKGEGRLVIYRYPGRPRCIPRDDEDLVMRGVVWTRERGDAVMQGFRRYHPHLVDRIAMALKEGRHAQGFTARRDPEPG